MTALRLEMQMVADGEHAAKMDGQLGSPQRWRFSLDQPGLPTRVVELIATPEDTPMTLMCRALTMIVYGADPSRSPYAQIVDELVERRS